MNDEANNPKAQENGIHEFVREPIKPPALKPRKYFSDIFDGMAKGLFASLIIGTIFKQIGASSGFSWLEYVGAFAQFMMGPAIGAGVAFRRGVKPYTLLSAIAAGAIGAGTIMAATGANDAAIWVLKIGDPAGALIAAWAAMEIGRLIEGRTKFDLLLVPGAMVLAAGILGYFVSPVIRLVMENIGIGVNTLTQMYKFPMGVLVALAVGTMLTLPMVSSTAICVMIQIDGLAAGAALAGCCAQMVGFAAISFRDNRWSGLVAQGLGTSMIQFPNIIRKPIVWVPPLVASAVCGPLSTLVFKMTTHYAGAGMGTSGLVGPITTLGVMGYTPKTFLYIGLLYILIPAAVSLLVAEVMRAARIIRPGDLRLT